MAGLNATQLRNLIVKPTLEGLGLWSEAAEDLVTGTIYQESHATYLKQLGAGPALGICQMEPATHDDIWKNFINYRQALNLKLRGMVSHAEITKDEYYPDAKEMIGNLVYAVAMCRVHYYRQPEPLPNLQYWLKKSDGLDKAMEAYIQELGIYWKKHYNTEKGAGTVEEFVKNYRSAGTTTN